METKRVRAGGICVVDNKILLIHRINLAREDGIEEYYVIPGGGVENEESVENAVIREMKEETNIEVIVKNLFYKLDNNLNNKEEFYYICEYVNGEAKLREDSEEKEEIKKGINFYKPVWVPINEIKDIILYPEQIKKELMKVYL